MDRVYSKTAQDDPQRTAPVKVTPTAMPIASPYPIPSSGLNPNAKGRIGAAFGDLHTLGCVAFGLYIWKRRKKYNGACKEN